MELYDLKPYLHISLDDFDNDALLTSLYESAKQVFTNLTNIELSNTTDYTFTYYDLVNTRKIYFNKFPVNSITSVKYRDNFTDSLSTLDSADYELNDNVLYFATTYSVNKMVITADVGYSTIPDNIDFLLVQIVNHYFNFQANKIHLSSEGNVPLMPNEATMPKYLYDQIREYKIGL